MIDTPTDAAITVNHSRGDVVVADVMLGVDVDVTAVVAVVDVVGGLGLLPSVR